MRIVLYTNSVSAHQLPLAREIVKRVGIDNFRYVYTGDSLQGGAQEVEANEPWIVPCSRECLNGGMFECLNTCEVLIASIRDVDLFERRADKGLTTFYQSERWFKPLDLKLKIPLPTSTSSLHLLVPGKLRMLIPSYRSMAKRFVEWMKSDPNARYLAIGPWAKKDALWLGVSESKIVDWGYFVDPSTQTTQTIKQPKQSNNPLRVLWVGRPLWWKRVDTIRKAVAHVLNVTLDEFTNISLKQVREEMRKHDVYVLASNELEGWGAVVNEALSEGLPVIGTYEAGASAALLPQTNLFHAGDWRKLAEMLDRRTYAHICLPDEYTPSGAAKRLESLIGEMI